FVRSRLDTKRTIEFVREPEEYDVPLTAWLGCRESGDGGPGRHKERGQTQASCSGLHPDVLERSIRQEERERHEERRNVRDKIRSKTVSDTGDCTVQCRDRQHAFPRNAPNDERTQKKDQYERHGRFR